MVGAIGLALLKTLSSYMFGEYLKESYGSTDIDGAPSWYGTESRYEVCVSTFKRGKLESVEEAKKESQIKLQKKIEKIIDVIIYKKFKNLKPDEEALLQAIAKDKKLGLFIRSSTNYKNIKYDEDEKIAFVRNCILKEDFIDYEKKRVKLLTRDLSYYKSDKAFDELKTGEIKKKSTQSDKAFDELNEE